MYNDVEMFSRAEMENYASKEVERALKSDREIARINLKATKVRNSERVWAWALAAVLIVVTLTIGYNVSIPNPLPPVNERFRWVGDHCFVLADEEFCAVIADKDTINNYLD